MALPRESTKQRFKKNCLCVILPDWGNCFGSWGFILGLGKDNVRIWLYFVKTTLTWGRRANKPEPALLGSTRTVGRAEGKLCVYWSQTRWVRGRPRWMMIHMNVLGGQVPTFILLIFECWQRGNADLDRSTSFGLLCWRLLNLKKKQLEI